MHVIVYIINRSCSYIDTMLLVHFMPIAQWALLAASIYVLPLCWYDAEKRRYSALFTYNIYDWVKKLWSLGFWLISFVWCITCCYKYLPWSPHDGVFMECIDINTIESEVVQLLKGRDKWKLIFKLLNCLFTV